MSLSLTRCCSAAAAASSGVYLFWDRTFVGQELSIVQKQTAEVLTRAFSTAQ